MGSRLQWSYVYTVHYKGERYCQGPGLKNAKGWARSLGPSEVILAWQEDPPPGPKSYRMQVTRLEAAVLANILRNVREGNAWAPTDQEIEIAEIVGSECYCVLRRAEG